MSRFAKSTAKTLSGSPAGDRRGTKRLSGPRVLDTLTWKHGVVAARGSDPVTPLPERETPGYPVSTRLSHLGF